jgi:uncharacterized protein YqgC (DUF456 family)
VSIVTGVDLAVALIVLVGIVGIVVPVLPGLLLVWAGIAVWATERQDSTGWVLLAAVTALALAGTAVKYVLPGRRMRTAGVPARTMLAGGVLGLVGFVVVPVVGLLLGFVLGVYLAERRRLGRHDTAWTSTVVALKAAGWSMLIELFTGLLMAGTWAVTAILA